MNEAKRISTGWSLWVGFCLMFCRSHITTDLDLVERRITICETKIFRGRFYVLRIEVNDLATGP